MMTINRICLLQRIIILAVLFPLLPFYAQTTSLTFEQIAKVDDISLGKINAIIQDTYGFMWFSDQTNRCILRYDGSQMKRYAFNPENQNALGGFYPECFAKGANGALWIGFGDQGLDRFDPDTETFTHYVNDPNDPDSIISNAVNAVHVDKQGMVWVGTRDGLDLLDPKTGKFTHFQHKESDSTSLSHNIVRVIYEDSRGTIWVGTGVPWNGTGEGGLNRYNPTSKSFTRFLHRPNDANSLKANQVRAICEDSKGNFWIGTGKNGIHLLDRDKGKIQRFKNNGAKDALNVPEGHHDIQHITFIHEDLQGFLWIGTFNQGIHRWDPQSNTITRYGNEGIRSGNYTDNSSWWSHVSNDGLVWISTQDNKLFRIDPNIPKISEVPQEFPISDLVVRNTFEVWMGTNGHGLIQQNRNNGENKYHRYDKNNPLSLSNDRVISLYLDKSDQLWVGTANGLNYYDEGANAFTRFLHDPLDPSSLNSSIISDIYEDNESNLWVGTNAGVNKLNKAKGTFTRYNYEHVSPVGDLAEGVMIIEDKAENLWFGVPEGGLYQANEESRQLELRIAMHNTRDLVVDEKGILWVGANTGLWNSNKDWTKITPFKIIETGVFIGEWTYSLTADDKDNLWIGTDQGIIKLGRDRKNKEIFGLKNGVLPGPPNLRNAYKDKEGKIYFSSSPLGYYTFHPEEFSTIKDEMDLFVMDLRVNNEPVYPEAGGVLETSLIHAKEFRLNHNENVFNVTFAVIDFRTELKKKIFYMLEGYDNEWQEILSGQKVNYNKVPPGQYTLRYKAAIGNSSEWKEKGIELLISPPWWQTGWAYSCYILLLLFTANRVHVLQKEKTIRREREKAQEKELKQAEEIKKAYAELQTTQSQLIQSEKMASLGELTAGIAHEIQNPLNFVNNFSDVNKELLEELNEEIQKGNFDEVKALAKDVTDNEEKIIFHGKRADAIVKGMLQHSRASSGDKELIDLNVLADEYLRLAYHGLRAKDKTFNANIKTHFDEGLDKVNVVPQDIGRVILNLITNAFYVVKEKGEQQPEGYQPTVTVTTKKKKDIVLLSVKDNGNGIPKKIQDKIFQPFFTTKPTGQGTGLGLSMSYDIVTKGHGGTLQMKTREGQGTEFTIELPVK